MLIFMSISAVSAEVNLTSENTDIYVSNNDNPLPDNATIVFSSIRDAVESASDNSTIIICDGTYGGVYNTGLTINKNLTIRSYSNNTVIDGEGKYQFFNVKSSSSLILKDLKFINGFSNLNSNQAGILENYGYLTIDNVDFSKMNAFMGVIFNNGELYVSDSKFSSCKASTLGQAIVNTGKCSIFDSIISKEADSKIDVSVYNGGILVVNSSNINSINSNYDYGDDTYTLSVEIYDSRIQTCEFENTTSIFENIYVSSNFVLKNSVAYINNVTTAIPRYSYTYSFSAFNSNVTVISSVFTNGINAPNTILNITYSVILGGITGTGMGSKIYAPYNWWGDNRGPNTEHVKADAENWVVMLFEASPEPIEVATNATFTVSMNKISSNGRIYDLPNPKLLPKRYVHMESESGYFFPSEGYVDGEFRTRLINNTEDSLVYANVDSQKSRLIIGNGSTDYALYVSDSLGNNAYGDGSYENPYKTLDFAISKALNGNTIYLLDGIYTYAYNSELSITKNLTIIGLGDVVLKRDDNRNIFSISKTGNLLIRNVNFTVLSDSYDNSLFIVNGGNLTIENSRFYDIDSTSVIDCESNSLIRIDNSSFKNSRGSVCDGYASVLINNSLFENIIAHYWNSIYHDYNYLFTASRYIEVYNSEFRKNTMGIINMHPIIQYSSGLLQLSMEEYSYNSYALFKNSTFEGNEFKDLVYPYVAFKMYESYGSFSGFVDSCTFIKNKGLKMDLNVIDSSVFTDNSQMLINALTVNSSIFERNSNLVQSGSAYSGNGIVNAPTVINSTFVSNSAAYGGALYNPKSVHYSVFINNTARYEGNDIFSYSGDVDYSGNWWGDNQKPDSSKVYLFLGTLKMDSWIIMTLESTNKTVKASLNTLTDESGKLTPLNYIINQRMAYFSTEEGTITPNSTRLHDNEATAVMSYDGPGNFKIYAKIDNQLLDIFVKNNSTRILMDDASFYGKYNMYDITLVNINGQKISNQTLTAEIIDENGKKEIISLLTDENGLAYINFHYPVGNYTVNAFYEGNGYFEKSNATAKVSVLMADTILTSYNHTYYGKNNVFYAFLTDGNKKALENRTISFKIINSKGQSKVFNSTTDGYGRAEIHLTLDEGRYTIESSFESDGWYSNSNSTAYIHIYSVNSTIYVPNVTLYGIGNLYNITLKNQYGSLISGENVYVVISQGDLSDEFVLTTNENGVAQLAINYLPGSYNVTAEYRGDYIYGPSSGKGVINVEKVLTRVSGFYHVEIPLNGVYAVVLTDMYGRYLADETITLNMYKGSLIRTYEAKTTGTGEAIFRIDLNEGKYLATFDYDGSTWYEASTGAATIIVNNQTVFQDVELNASDLIQYFGEDKYFVISFKDPNAFSQYGKTIDVTITSDTISQSYKLLTDAFGQARMQIRLNPGIYNISYSYSNSYYNIYGESSNLIYVYKMPSTIRASDVILKKGEDKALEISLRDVNNNPIRNMQVNVELAGKKYTLTTNDEGIARLLIDLDLGEYGAEFSFANENYLSSSGSARILVTDSDKTSTYLKGSDINAKENEPLNYSLTLSDELANPISGFNVNLNIFDTDGNFMANYSNDTDFNGIAQFNFALPYGNYLLSAVFSGSSRYLESSTLNYLNVYAGDNLTKTILSGKLGYKNSYNIILIDEHAEKLQNRELKVSVNNNTFYLLTDDNGEASFDLGFEAGHYDISVNFNGDETHLKSSFSDHIVLSGNSSYLFADDLTKYYRNGTQFYVQLLDSVGMALMGKDILFSVNGTNLTNITDENGWATLVIDYLPGEYDVTCSYENISTKAKITVLSTIIASDLIKEFKNATGFDARVIDGSGAAIVDTNVTMLFDGKFYVRSTDSEGFVHLDIDSNPGNYTITVQNPYDGLRKTYNIIVLPSAKLISTEIIGNLTSEGYVLTLIDANNKSLANARLSIKINNNDYSVITDNHGQILIEITKNGIYNIKAYFAGDGLYEASSFEYALIVSANRTQLIASDVIKYYKNGTQFYAQLLDESGSPMANENITLAINGMNYTRQTNASGWIRFNINLNPGVYDLYCAYWGSNPDDDAFALANITVLSTIMAENLVKYYKNASQFYVKVLDGEGNPLINTNVTMNINGVFYTRLTNGEGVARLNINLNPGEYILSVTNPNDGLMRSFNVTVLSTIISENLVKYYRNASQFCVKLLDGEGNPLVNSNVTMNINGVFYTRITDEWGIARLNINLNPGEYTITTTDESGLSVSNKITVLSTLIAKDLHMKYLDGSKFEVNVLNGKGNPYPNQEVTFNINGVFYTRTSDENGIARLNINLMPGKYIISSTYDTLTISNYVVVYQ